MATYNGARFLAAQLESLARQTHLPNELQVGDDGSVDETIAILEKFALRAPFPVRIFRNSRNVGFGENFINTASRCKSDWVAFCDQDDVWFPGKLEYCARIIAANDGLMLVEHNATVANSSLEPGWLMDNAVRQGLYPRASLRPGWISPGFRQIFRRDLITGIPATDRHMSWWTDHEDAHDAWTSLLASACGPIFISDDPLVFYRRHDTNTTPLSQRKDSLFGMIRAALRDNSQHYLNEAEKALQIADVLRELSARSTPRFSVALARSARETVRYSQLNSQRAIVYQEAGLLSRQRALLALALAGGYSGGASWKPGVRAFVKDAFNVFFPASKGVIIK